jgi:hypothetical protein
MNFVIVVLGGVFVASLFFGGPPIFLPPWTAAFLFSVAMFLRSWAIERREGRRLFDLRAESGIFWLCLALYLGSFRWHGGDDIPNSLLPYQIWRHQTFAFDEVRAWATAPGMIDLIHEVRGRLLSTYPVAPAVLALPLYLIPSVFGPLPSDTLLHNLAKIAGSVITAFSVIVFYRAAVRRASPRWALDCTFLYGLGSYAYSVSSQALYSHGPAQLGVALGLLGLVSEGGVMTALAGFGFALSWASREDSAIFCFAAGLYVLLHRRQRLVAFAAGAVLPVALNLSYWKYYSGVFRPPYFGLQSAMFGHLDFHALLAMVFSPSRGMLFFFPAAGFGLWGAWRSWRKGDYLALYLVGACLGTWVAFALRTSWTAGNSYGDRYFAVVCLVLAFFCTELENVLRVNSTRRVLWATIFAYGVLIHAVGANFQWPGYRMTLEEQAATLWSRAMFPLATIFMDGGPISATPQPWRFVYGIALQALVLIPAWRWSYKRFGT